MRNLQHTLANLYIPNGHSEKSHILANSPGQPQIEEAKGATSPAQSNKESTPLSQPTPQSVKKTALQQELLAGVDADQFAGKAEMPRAKPGKSAIQDSERDPDNWNRVMPHPDMVRVSLHGDIPQDVFLWLKDKFEQVKECKLNGEKKTCKWLIPKKLELRFGMSKVTIDGVEKKMGHVPLVGGGDDPDDVAARIGGVISYDPATDEFVFDNDSGRYSEYPDRKEEHLDNVMPRIKEIADMLGVRVRKKWEDKPWQGAFED